MDTNKSGHSISTHRRSETEVASAPDAVTGTYYPAPDGFWPRRWSSPDTRQTVSGLAGGVHRIPASRSGEHKGIVTGIDRRQAVLIAVIPLCGESGSSRFRWRATCNNPASAVPGKDGRQLITERQRGLDMQRCDVECGTRVTRRNVTPRHS